MGTEVVTGFFTIAGVIIGGCIQNIIATQNRKNEIKNSTVKKRKEIAVEILKFVNVSYGMEVHKYYNNKQYLEGTELITLQAEVDLYFDEDVKRQFNKYIEILTLIMNKENKEDVFFFSAPNRKKIDEEKEKLVSLLKLSFL